MRARRLSVLFLVLLTTLVASRADAFHEVSSFARTANTGGGAGKYFTGSRRDKGYDCNICHVAAEQRIEVQVDSPLSAGTYQAGLIYPITIRLLGEHRGLESAFNPNTFSADITDESGTPVGQFAGGAGTGVELELERTLAIAEGFGNGETEWSFSWWAPDVATAATLRIAMLDGDGASDPERRFIDPLNDDVATLSLSLCPQGESCAPVSEPSAEVSPTGCRAAGGNGQPRSIWLAPLLLLAFGYGSRRRCRSSKNL